MTVPATRRSVTPPIRAPRAVAWAATVVLALLVAACGATTPSSSPSVASPAPSASGGPSDAAPTPRPTPWPGSTADGVIGLGSGAGQIGLALQDLQKAVNDSDPRAMLGAAQGFNRLLKQLEPNIARIRDYPLTRPLADQTKAAFDVLIPATQALSDDLLAGNAANISADIARIGQGMDLWSKSADQLSDLVAQALEQKRLLTE